MPRGPKPTPITLTDDERGELAGWAARPTTAQALALRARVVLAAAGGAANAAIAAGPRVTAPTVRKRRDRLAASRLAGLTDEPRPGAPRSVTDEQVERAVSRTLESRPKDATHWSTRGLAADLGLSQTAVARAWRAFGLRPHLRETFKPSTDPFLVEKVRDVVGLCLTPPGRAIVLCVDERSQAQALGRTQPSQPPLPGRAEKATHDHARHGTTSLLSALNVATGGDRGVPPAAPARGGSGVPGSRGRDARARAGPAVHVVMDDYGTHEHPRARGWLVRRPEFVPHFTPTSASWLSQVERLFAEITNRRIRRGSFKSVEEPERAIEGYLSTQNERPRPSVWTKSADLILDKVRRVCQRLAPTGKPETYF